MRLASLDVQSDMSTTRAITLRLEPADYERLEAEAERLGMPPATLARVSVRAGLSNGKETELSRSARHSCRHWIGWPG
jgi:predicted DNA-binding protein